MRNIENGTAILRESAYDKGYKDGVTCGKLCAYQQILDELDEILTSKLEAFNRIQEDPTLASPLKHEPEYWSGRAVTCGEILRVVTLLKKKYEVL